MVSKLGQFCSVQLYARLQYEITKYLTSNQQLNASRGHAHTVAGHTRESPLLIRDRIRQEEIT